VVLIVAGNGAAGRGAEDAATVPLREAIDALARQHGFGVSGLYRVDEAAPAPFATGALPDRLRTLLKGYNYVLINRSGGRVETLRIVGRKVTRRRGPETIVIQTVRRGAHHVVDATLISKNGTRVVESLIVDTGASTVVLPLSKAEGLGFDRDALEAVEMRTANGVATMLRGELAAMEVGGLRVANVAVTFVDDAKVGRVQLLGMSFLRGFRVVLDDRNTRLMLIREAE